MRIDFDDDRVLKLFLMFEFDGLQLFEFMVDVLFFLEFEGMFFFLDFILNLGCFGIKLKYFIVEICQLYLLN